MSQPHQVSLSSPQFRGVDVEHPTMREYAKNLARQGKNTEDIAKIIGLPCSVVKRYQTEVAREMDMEKAKREDLRRSLETAGRENR